MDKEPVVSVLVITYNQAKFVEHALESVLGQETAFPIEILVGDDCSTDGTSGIITQFTADSRLRVFQRPCNLGATKNLYDLQTRARGRYIAYLEGDDYWKQPDKLQKQVEFLEKHKEYIGCTHRCEIVDENGDSCKKQRLNWVCQKQIYTLKDFKGLMLPGHQSTLVHRNIFRSSQERYKDIITLNPLIADRSLILLLVSFGPIYRLSECMSCYRVVQAGRGENATVVAYSGNANRVWDDYVYTKELEAYAKSVLDVDGGFEHHKKDLFVSAVYRVLREPNRVNRRVAKEILREGNLFLYLVYLPIGFIKKTVNRLFYR